jgi:hypothetical protein
MVTALCTGNQIVTSLRAWHPQERITRLRNWGLLGLGLLGSFNKGLSGGGYGPLLTIGQILSGVNAKSAVVVGDLYVPSDVNRAPTLAYNTVLPSECPNTDVTRSAFFAHLSRHDQCKTV